MPIGPESVRTAREAWKRAVEALDVEATVALYDLERGWLLGTLDTGATEERHTPARIRDYFEHFLDQDAVRVTFFRPVTEENVQQYGPGHAGHSGYYEFALTKNDHTDVVRATYTFVYDRVADGRILILTHNSGLTTEGIRGF